MIQVLGLVTLGILAASVEAVWSPNTPVSWHLQLNGVVPTDLDVAMIDFDLFDTPQETIDAYKAAGTIVICYFSAGSYEEWRSDAGEFPSSILGNDLDGWAGEKWLDIRDQSYLPAIMKARMDLAVSKKCDGIDPDNVNGYSNPTGFSLTVNDQKTYNLWLANEAHSRSLSIGLKNSAEQIEDLKNSFDWALNEECFQFGECDLYDPFTALNKVVFGVEYEGFTTQDSFKTQVCDVAGASKKSWLYTSILLNSTTKCACVEPGTSINCDQLLTASSSNYFASTNSSSSDSSTAAPFKVGTTASLVLIALALASMLV